MTKKITEKEVIATLEQIVAEAGEDHTAMCYYTAAGEYMATTEQYESTIEDEETPMCIAGTYVFKVGGVEALQKLYEMTIITAEYNRAVLEGLGLTEKARDVLRAAQSMQDSGKSWGLALDRAKELAK